MAKNIFVTKLTFNVCEIYLQKTKFDHFNWSKITKFSLSTMVLNTKPSSKKILVTLEFQINAGWGGYEGLKIE